MFAVQKRGILRRSFIRSSRGRGTHFANRASLTPHTMFSAVRMCAAVTKASTKRARTCSFSTMNKLGIADVDLTNQRVLIRVDFNVPFGGDVRRRGCCVQCGRHVALLICGSRPPLSMTCVLVYCVRYCGSPPTRARLATPSALMPRCPRSSMRSTTALRCVPRSAMGATLACWALGCSKHPARWVLCWVMGDGLIGAFCSMWASFYFSLLCSCPTWVAPTARVAQNCPFAPLQSAFRCVLLDRRARRPTTYK